MKRNMAIKKLWKGVFNYRTGMSIEYAYAYSKLQAKVMMLRRLAIKHEVSYQTVFGLFNGDKPNFLIEEEKICPKSKMVLPEHSELNTE